jgi:hypothetical protein
VNTSTPPQSDFAAELPPAHPKWREFTIAGVMAHSKKLKEAGDSQALIRLRDAVVKVARQPPQGAWHEVKTGMVNGCRILSPFDVAPFLFQTGQGAKIGLCLCGECVKNRRLN